MSGMDGPDIDLINLFSVASNGPSVMRATAEDGGALAARVQQAATVEDLSGEDRELIERGAREVGAGLSPTLVHPGYLSDWAAEDAAADEAAGVEGEASEHGRRGPLVTDADEEQGDPDAPDDADADADADADPDDDELAAEPEGGWVGL